MAPRKSTPKRPNGNRHKADAGYEWTARDKALSARGEALNAERDAIRKRSTEHAMRARLLAAHFLYGADLLEQELGHPDRREEWRKWIDQIWIKASPYPNENEWKWAALLATIRVAAREADSVRFPGALPARPGRETRWLLTDAHGVKHFGEVPTDEETAREEIDRLARDWPDMAGRIDPLTLAAVLPLWRARRKAGGRAGRKTTLWKEIVALGVAAGLPRVSESAVRGIRDRVVKGLPPIDH